jgi:hypothetical protein
MSISIILSILGILVGILSIPWLKRPAERWYSKARAGWIRWTYRRELASELVKVLKIREGIASHLNHDFFICEWKHEVQIDSQGNTQTSIDCLLVNICREEKREVVFPVYFENANQDLQGWAKIGRVRNHLKPYEHDPNSGLGLFKIQLPLPLQPQDSVRLRWGYFYPQVFEIGENWWEWYFGRPHSNFSLRLTTAAPWKIANVRTRVLPPTYLAQGAVLHGQKITWTVRAPSLGHKYRIDFTLARG